MSALPSCGTWPTSSYRGAPGVQKGMATRSAALWALLGIARWRYGETSRLKELEKRPGGAILMDLLLWRLTAHLGPYQARIKEMKA